jgi:hypothetical protein
MRSLELGSECHTTFRRAQAYPYLALKTLTMVSSTYSQSLRAIAQDLEARHVKAFDIERHNDEYLVWVRIQTQPPAKNVPSIVARSVRLRLRRRPAGQKEYSAVPEASGANQLRYSPEDVDRLEQKAQARRHKPNGMADGHSMSQLLRAVGGYISRRGVRLLAISWREEFVSVVYETAEGRREMDNFRLDSIYDLWVHMYVRRKR